MRCDTNAQLWEICQIPRRRDGHTKEKTLSLLGFVMDQVTIVNDGLPPLAVAQDFHGSHLLILQIFLGVFFGVLDGIPFFKDVEWESMDFIPFFVYSVMKWFENYIFGHGDAAHLQKSWVEQLRSGLRWIKVAGVWASMVSGVAGGPPTFNDTPRNYVAAEPFWIYDRSIISV